MPEFILDHGSPDAAIRFAALDKFTQGYIEAMFWTADEEITDASFDELAPEALALAIEDCNDFNLSADCWLDKAYQHGTMSYDMHRAGVDFWLTRNHHGDGFWDRGLGAAGDELTKQAHAYGSCDLYRGDDGLLYLA